LIPADSSIWPIGALRNANTGGRSAEDPAAEAGTSDAFPKAEPI
jgi:hypothetical protein